MERFAALALAVCALSAPSAADGRNPGSVLFYVVHRSGPAWFTIVSVTNTNTLKASPNSFGGTTDVHYQYVNATKGTHPLRPADCNITNRVERLTPADTLSVLTTCHNAFHPGGQEGYLVISAVDPIQGEPWCFDYLVGSEFVVNASGTTYTIEAIPFEHANKGPNGGGEGGANGILYFDGVDYEAAPEHLIIPSFLALDGSHLALINLTGSLQDLNKVKITLYNDNEFLLSDTFEFNCWFDQRMTTVSQIFSAKFLKSTPNDPAELDITCSGSGRVETGWAFLDSIGVKTPGGEFIDSDGVILGSMTVIDTQLDGGNLLWESCERQTNGAAFNP
jgi:hypothetical protein